MKYGQSSTAAIARSAVVVPFVLLLLATLANGVVEAQEADDTNSTGASAAADDTAEGTPAGDTAAADTAAETRPFEDGSFEDHKEVAIFDTTQGRMVIAFHDDDAPQTAAQIKRLIRDGFYDGKVFYRVVAGHVIQTGDVDGRSAPRVPLEAGRLHIEGAVGMARGPNPNSGTTEIYICLAPRPHLDGQYAIFGHVVEGLDTLRAIGAVDVDEKFLPGGVAYHSPKTPVTIERATLETRSTTRP